jgi:hypothetical protein
MSDQINIEKIHEDVLNEEELSVKDLPLKLQKKIKGWNLMFNKLKANPEDEKLERSLQKQSVTLADAIQDFIEKEYEDDDSSSDGDSKGKEEGGSKKDDGTEPKNKKEPKEEPNPDVDDEDDGNADSDGDGDGKSKKEPKQKGFGNLVMKKKIMDEIKKNGDGRIDIDVLESIIGKEADYPEQKVHDITLRKVFLASAYRLL